MGRKKEPNSWRSQGKGDCFTTKGGQVVCEGSKGMSYKPKGRKKSTAKGVRIQTKKAKDKKKDVGKFKIVGTTMRKGKKSGKDKKYIEVERIGGSKKKGDIKFISEKTYQSNFVRI